MSSFASLIRQKAILITVSLFIISIQAGRAQDSALQLQGTVDISIKEGTIDCDLTLSHIPRIKDYFIRINSGMNIRNFECLMPNHFVLYYEKSPNDSRSTGESFAYYFPDNTGKGKFLPRAIRFRYGGKYPVIGDTLNDDYSIEDWRGNIAFNGYSVRADGMQSAWFPILYDIKKDVRYCKVVYDLEVNCKDCDDLFVNGNKPVKGRSAHFKSNAPIEPLLFCGNYMVAQSGGNYVLNPDINKDQINNLAENTDWYKRFYAGKLHIPYEGSITFIHTTPTSKSNAFSFISYPSIINVGWGKYGLQGLANADEHTIDVGLGHELGHYYFGTYKIFNTEFGRVMTEGFATYLSFKAVQARVNDSVYRKFIFGRLRSIRKFSAVPFNQVKSREDFHNGDIYVYNYAALIFLSIESEIGEQRMWEWLRNILTTKVGFTDYSLLVQTLNNTLKDPIELDAIKSKYFESDQSIQNIETALEQL